MSTTTTPNLFSAFAQTAASMTATGNILESLQTSLAHVASRAREDQSHVLGLLGQLPEVPAGFSESGSESVLAAHLGLDAALAGLVAARAHLADHAGSLNSLADVAATQAQMIHNTRQALLCVASIPNAQNAHQDATQPQDGPEVVSAVSTPQTLAQAAETACPQDTHQPTPELAAVLAAVDAVVETAGAVPEPEEPAPEMSQPVPAIEEPAHETDAETVVTVAANSAVADTAFPLAIPVYLPSPEDEAGNDDEDANPTISTTEEQHLTPAEERTLTAAVAFLHDRRGDGQSYTAQDIFPARSHQDNASRRTLKRLMGKEVFAAHGIEADGDRLRCILPW